MGNLEAVGDRVEYVLVRQFVGHLATNQVASRRGLHELLVRSPERTVDALYRVLAEDLAGSAEPFVLSLLASEESRLRPLVNGSMDPATAARIARALCATDPTIESMLLRQATREREPQATIRALSLLEEFSDFARLLQPLQLLSRQPNELVRSKAARILARVSREGDRLVQLFADPDPRVRANSAEAFFSVCPKPAESEELWRLSADPHHRPATTALAVLALYGDQKAIDKLVELVNSPEPHVQLAAAWAMGRAQQQAFLPVLQALIREQSGNLKRMSMRSCALIRKNAVA